MEKCRAFKSVSKLRLAARNFAHAWHVERHIQNAPPYKLRRMGHPKFQFKGCAARPKFQVNDRATRIVECEWKSRPEPLRARGSVNHMVQVLSHSLFIRPHVRMKLVGTNRAH
jgi:hypothetical protein